MAAAQVVVEDILPDRPHIEVPSARGRIGPRDEAVGVAGLLGPADRLEVRWSARAEPGPADTAGAVEGLLLWDAEPAGDHVQARLTYRGTGGTSTIRLGLDPGMVLRAGSLDGLVDATWQGSDERPEWVASVDPPAAPMGPRSSSNSGGPPRARRRGHARCRGSSHWESNATAEHSASAGRPDGRDGSPPAPGSIR